MIPNILISCSYSYSYRAHTQQTINTSMIARNMSAVRIYEKIYMYTYRGL